MPTVSRHIDMATYTQTFERTYLVPVDTQDVSIAAAELGLHFERGETIHTKTVISLRMIPCGLSCATPVSKSAKPGRMSAASALSSWLVPCEWRARSEI